MNRRELMSAVAAIPLAMISPPASEQALFEIKWVGDSRTGVGELVSLPTQAAYQRIRGLYEAALNEPSELRRERYMAEAEYLGAMIRAQMRNRS